MPTLAMGNTIVLVPLFYEGPTASDSMSRPHLIRKIVAAPDLHLVAVADTVTVGLSFLSLTNLFLIFLKYIEFTYTSMPALLIIFVIFEKMLARSMVAS
jgi:hypothetical protein